MSQQPFKKFINPKNNAAIKEKHKQEKKIAKKQKATAIEKRFEEMVERGEGVAFLPRMCVEEELRHGLVKEVKVKELEMERKIRLVFPARRALSHAAEAFLEVVGG